MSASFEIAYTIKSCSSQQDAFPSSNLASGGKWSPHASLGMAHVDLDFGTSFSIHSLSFSACGGSSVKIVLMGRKGERANYMGGGAMQYGGAYNIGERAAEVYEGPLPTASVECKQLLQCRSSGAGRLLPIASQEEWTGLRLCFTPAPGSSTRPPDTFYIRRLEVNRQPTEDERKRIAAEQRPQAPTLTEANLRSYQPPPSSQPAASAASASNAGGSSSAHNNAQRPQASSASAQSSQTARVSELPPAAPMQRPGQKASSTSQLRQACECGKPGCNGCGQPCKDHSKPCILKTCKYGKVENKGRRMWMCPLPNKPLNGLPPPPGRLYSCGFKAWADETIGHDDRQVSLEGFDEEDQMPAPPPKAPAAAAPNRPSMPSSMPPPPTPAGLGKEEGDDKSKAEASSAFLTAAKQAFMASEGGDTAYRAFKDGLKRQLQGVKTAVRSDAAQAALRELYRLFAPFPAVTHLAADLAPLLPEGRREMWIKLVKSRATPAGGGGSSSKTPMSPPITQQTESKTASKTAAHAAKAAATQTAASKAAACEDLTQLSIGELKRRLTDRGVDFSTCVEKSELVKLLVVTGGGGGGAAAGASEKKEGKAPAAPAAPAAGDERKRKATARAADEEEDAFLLPSSPAKKNKHHQPPPPPQRPGGVHPASTSAAPKPATSAAVKKQQKAEEASRQDFFAAAYAQQAAREAGAAAKPAAPAKKAKRSNTGDDGGGGSSGQWARKKRSQGKPVKQEGGSSSNGVEPLDRKKLKRNVLRIVREAEDINSLTSKMVRKQLEEVFDCELKPHKEQIEEACLAAIDKVREEQAEALEHYRPKPNSSVPAMPVKEEEEAETEDEEEEEEEEEEDEDATDDEEEATADLGRVVCWPIGVARCQYDEKEPCACYRLNTKHLYQEAHCVEHVKAHVRKVFSEETMHEKVVGPGGLMKRTLESGGLKVTLPMDCVDVEEVREELLHALDKECDRLVAVEREACAADGR